MYSANRPVRTLTLHKAGCRHIRGGQLEACGCGYTGSQGNQRWWCEEHVAIEAVDEFMRQRFWAPLLCGGLFAWLWAGRYLLGNEAVSPRVRYRAAARSAIAVWL